MLLHTSLDHLLDCVRFAEEPCLPLLLAQSGKCMHLEQSLLGQLNSHTTACCVLLIGSIFLDTSGRLKSCC